MYDLLHLLMSDPNYPMKYRTKGRTKPLSLAMVDAHNAAVQVSLALVTHALVVGVDTTMMNMVDWQISRSQHSA